MPSTLIDVPLATNTLAASQPSIRTNFNVISVAFSQDHVNYNVTIGDGTQGMHNQVTFPRQGGDSVTTGTNVAVYSKLNAAGTESALFFRKQTNGAVIDFTSSLQNQSGWTRLPSGILLKWGQAAMTANTNVTVAFPVGAGIPVFTAIYNIQATSYMGNNGASAPQLSNITVLGFDIYSRRILLDPATGNFQYFAIGLG